MIDLLIIFGMFFMIFIASYLTNIKANNTFIKIISLIILSIALLAMTYLAIIKLIGV